uniref:Reverse transcriptase zinc-binding domain-containing protein n=1 Tax=Populus alba TaxID=43335 RepID=A0A4U5PN31_POPAL|nr:hypothetical protein D5086_0000206310 [Populus alba]
MLLPLSSNTSLKITFVYGLNTPAGRGRLWDYILRQTPQFSSSPWVLMGDFNATLKATDRSGGDTNWYSHLEDFGSCIHDAELSHIPYSGLKFSWHNGQLGKDAIMKKLDWIFGNFPFLSNWPAAHANFLPRDHSDHSAMILALTPPSPRMPAPFKFLNMWADRMDFQDIVKAAWQSPVNGNPMYRFTSKLQLIKHALKALHRNNSSHISARVAEAKTRWNFAQVLLDESPTSEDLLAAERECAVLYSQLCKDEEAIFKQRSRIQWLKLGDRNTKFFHRSLLHRQSRNGIHVLADETAMDSFSKISGLAINHDKSYVFLSGVDPDLRIAITNQLSFKPGTLPVKYLGVPLISTRLTYQNCVALIDRITSRIKVWTSASLTYAGRLQLVKSTLFSIQVYWSSMFILPCATVKKIESILSAFLWKGTALTHTGAKVAWTSLCYPLQEGGLGIKSIKTWNKAALLKHVWRLLSEGTSLWVSWVHSVLLRRRCFWYTNVPSSSSWSWRKILQSRRWCKGMFTPCIGNGRDTFLWLDYWLPDNKRFCDLFPFRVLSSTGLPWDAKVSDIISDGRWAFPPRHPDLQPVWNSILSQPRPHLCDYYTWPAHSSGNFSIDSAWELLRDSRPLDSLYHLIWFQGHIPRQAFILWIASMERLHTMDRLTSFGIISSSTCVLCGMHNETHDHLFFQCTYSSTLWGNISAKTLIAWPSLTWNGLLLWAGSTLRNNKEFSHIIARLVLSTSVYFIWFERNNRIFNKVFKTAKERMDEAIDLIRICLLEKDQTKIPGTFKCIWSLPRS